MSIAAGKSASREALFGVRRSATYGIVLVLVASGWTTGCVGEDFAGVSVVNACSAAVEVAASRTEFEFGNSEWIEIAPGDREDALLNAPAGDLPIYLEVRETSPNNAAQSIFIQAIDGSEIRLRNAVCPDS